MNFFDRLAEKLGLRGEPSANVRLDTRRENLQTLLERMKRHKRSGEYDKALSDIEHANTIIQGYPQSLVNETLPFALRLHTADIYTQLKRFADAQNILLNLQSEAEQHKQKAYLAYVLIALGVLQQEQEQWDVARDYYERALRVAKEYKLLGAEGRAQAHLADTYLHEGNASYASYLLQEAIPKINTSGDMELSSYFVGRLGESLIIQGKKADGQNLIGRALRIAEQMEYRYYQIRWRIVLANEAIREGLYDEARRLLMHALAQMSLQSVKDPEKTVLVLCRLCKVCLRLNDITAAQDYLHQTNDFLDVVSARSKLLITTTQGIIARTLHDYSQAITSLKSAIDEGYLDQTWTDGEFSPVEVLRNLAVAYTEVGDYSSSKHMFDRALKLAEMSDDPLDIGGVQRDVGIFYMRQQQLDEALKAWSNALRVYEKRGQYARVARLYCDIAHFRKQYGQFKRAIQDYQMALQTLSSVDDIETRGVVLANTAIAFVDYSDMQTVESFFTESIKIAEQLGDKLAEATRRGNYGWFLYITGKLDRALEMLEHALHLSEQVGAKVQSAVQTDNIGLVYDEKGNYEKAVYYHAKAWEKLAGAAEIHWRGIVSANLGNSLVSLAKYEEAQQLLDIAHQSGQQEKDDEVIARSLMGLIRLNMAQHVDADMTAWIDEMQTHANATHSRRLIGDVYALISRYHASKSDLEKANATWQTANEWYRSLELPISDTRPSWLATD